MSYEQTITKQTVICEDRKKNIRILKEEQVLFVCKCNFLSEEIASECKYIDKDELEYIYSDIENQLEEITDKDSYDYYQLKLLLKDFQKIKENINWETDRLLYTAG